MYTDFDERDSKLPLFYKQDVNEQTSACLTDLIFERIKKEVEITIWLGYFATIKSKILKATTGHNLPRIICVCEEFYYTAQYR